MSETTTDIVPPAAAVEHRRPNRLYQAAAWVAIVAGIVFIVGAVFVTGLVLGRHGDGWGRHQYGGGQCPMTGRSMMGPGMGPGMMGPGMMGPDSGPGIMGPGRGGPGVPGATATPGPGGPPQPRS